MANQPLTNRPGHGVLFPKTVEPGSSRPNYAGGLNLDGVEYELAAWERRSKNGRTYLSLSVKAAANQSVAPQTPGVDFGD